ncbi:hypothetical protein NLU13_1142 [Sarocladium strictum]|uniref:SWR1-complex protein 3 domain-containing protein n=1 Tax=Sarocladium strictum TaxID=5046 RepID=A0AA39GQD6_SARSR|nr:hypothetical protein NLU13_1142 [Sarocladium strictum]
MEKKRKLPARAAARAEQVKRRNVTPRQRSVTPAAPAPEPPVEEAPPPPPPLPKSIQAGEPLPVVDEPQPEDLSAEEYQSVTESGVLAESLSRSRHKWLHEGLFEKYWTKPHKRKGVLQEDPKNPPKDSMTKVGHVTINIEPHLIEATMYVVKAPKPPPSQQPASQSQQPQTQQSPAASLPKIPAQPPQAAPTRPILQYGPPNGAMPPPKPQSPAVTTPSTPVAAAAQLQSADSKAGLNNERATPSIGQAATQDTAIKTESPRPPSAVVSASSYPSTTTNLAPPASGPPTPAAGPSQTPPQPPKSGLSMPPGLSSGRAPTAGPATVAARPPGAGVSGSTAKPAAPAPKAAASDPVIALLAQKASGDAELRDLMKRVAMGQAKPGELSHFQQIIDQLNQEYKRSGGQHGPSADRLLVDGKTVKWFAGEVRTILDIVLASNPNQKSSELKPPPRSDPLVVLLVKTALEDQRTRDTIRRIAEDRPGPYDAQSLKDTLDRLHSNARAAAQPPAAAQTRPGVPNGHIQGHPKLQPHHQPNQPNPQSLRSKGPPPAPKPDISAVVFDFGTGDRYLFPKYSILDTLTTPSGQQVVASFLIVRKGSTSEYGGDPKLDYYQPVTIRLQTQSGRQLENLTRVVAPVEEVRRYMDDVMDNMTRAEYVLLAMRLPRRSPEEGAADSGGDVAKSKPATPISQPSVETSAAPARPAVLWSSAATKSASGSPAQRPLRIPDPEEEAELRYQRLIQAVTAKDAVHV